MYVGASSPHNNAQHCTRNAMRPVVPIVLRFRTVRAAMQPVPLAQFVFGSHSHNLEHCSQFDKIHPRRNHHKYKENLSENNDFRVE